MAKADDEGQLWEAVRKLVPPLRGEPFVLLRIRVLGRL